MNTSQRLLLLSKFQTHLQQKLKKNQKQKPNFKQLTNKNQLNIDSLPKITILSDLSSCHQEINTTITKTYQQISYIMNKLSILKNKKQNTTQVLDILTSINQVKNLSYTLKVQNSNDYNEMYKILGSYFQIKGKAKYCAKYVNQIEQQINKIQQKYRNQFDAELKKTNSTNVKDISKVLELIKSQREKNNRNTEKVNEIIQNSNNQNNNVNSTSLIQISQFYVNLVRKQLSKYQQQLFNIPITGNATQVSYIFFQLTKNSFKTIVSFIQTYQHNILNLQSEQGLHLVLLNIFKYVMQILILQILIRQKKYYQIDKILITRNKLTLKTSQYKVLKNYFKEFNAIWNQIQRFRMHVEEYLEDGYGRKKDFGQQLVDITNNAKFVQFNYQIILYCQAFLRHQLDKIFKKNPFILSLWQFDEQFFKQIKNKNQYKNNLTGQDFIQQMCSKFTQGLKKSFQTLNILIISALINFINHHLIYEDSFYAFNQLLNRFLGKMPDHKAIEGIVLVLNTLQSYPKAVKSSFQQIQIPQQLPIQRIKNEVSQLILNCAQKTKQFISQSFSRIIAHEYIQSKIRQGKYQQVPIFFKNLQKQLYSTFIYKLSKSHVQLILQRQFKSIYSQMDAMDLQKEIRNTINFYEQKGCTVRQNFRKILIFIEILMIQEEGEFRNFIEELKGKYQDEELFRIWRLRGK